MRGFWTKDTRLLVDVAMGRHPASLVIKNGKWISVQTGEIIPGTDIAMIDDRIAYVGKDASHTIGPKTEILDVNGSYLVPGLIDGHMHVESGMLTISEFVRAVLPHGTTTMMIDPHEIANVFGIDGVKLMVDEAEKQPNHVFVQMPSCVPSAPGLETPGSSITPEEVETAMQWDGIIGLGEMMNFPGVAASDQKLHAEMDSTRKYKKVIGGHYAALDLGLPFHGYVAGGAEDDHEGTRMEDAIARARQGMKVMMRYGSAWHDVATQIKAITEQGLDSRNFILCTDDAHSETLINFGHMDRVIRHTISQGISPIKAIQMATINTAEHFKVTTEIGMIAPGRFGDILIVDDLINFVVRKVICKGRIVASEGHLNIPRIKRTYPEWAVNSVKISDQFTASDFQITWDKGQKVKANIIGVIENQAPTRHIQEVLIVEQNMVRMDLNKDIVKLAVVERHQKSGRVSVGFVQGFGFKGNCAIATTVAHDAHQLIVTGTNETMMAIAVNHLAKIGGGQVVVKDGEIIGEVSLPIAGLMSDQPAAIVAEQAATVLKGFEKCGCHLNNPNMQLSLLGLVVIPDVRLSDLGLVNVNKFDFIPVIEEI